MSSELLKLGSLQDFCDTYDQSVAEIARAFELLATAQGRMCRFIDRFEIINHDVRDYQLSEPDRLIKESHNAAHRSAWRELIKRSGVRTLMVEKRCKELDQILHAGELPPINPASITAFIDGLRGDMPRLVAEAIEEAARVLRPHDRAYKTNGDGWQLGRKAILEYMVSYDALIGWRIGYSRSAWLTSIDNAFHLLDGKGPAKHPATLTCAIETAMRAKLQACQTEYFDAKWFKNGNVHLEFRRLDLVDRLNARAADHTSLRDQNAAGTVNAAARHRQHAPAPVPTAEEISKFTDEERRRELGFFETPPALAERLVEMAGVALSESVLEPSAGRGAICRAILARMPAIPPEMLAVEIDPAHWPHLIEVLGDGTKVRAGDFLQLVPTPSFDRVIANPPFADGRDIEHVRRMFEWLKPGGRLVSVMSAGVQFRSDRKYADFRLWLEIMDASIERLPEGTFESSGTSVATCVVTIDKEAA